MLSKAIMERIFENTDEGNLLAGMYSLTAQHDCGVEWIARQSLAICDLVAYGRVASSSDDVCLVVNGILSKLSLAYLRKSFHCKDDDFIDVPTIRLLHELLECDRAVEDKVVEQLCLWIATLSMEGDAQHLLPLHKVR